MEIEKGRLAIWASVVITALRDESGSPSEVCAKVSRDITKRIEAEAAEKKREALELTSR